MSASTPASLGGHVLRRALVSAGEAWTRCRRWVTPLFVVAVVGLLAWHARTVDWRAVLEALGHYEAATLCLALGLTLASFAVYSCFDLLARDYTRAEMSVREVMLVTFVSHALGLNLGVAGVALRFRLYAAFGVHAATVARIWGLSVMTNWMGFVLLGGVVFSGRYLDLPAVTNLGGGLAAGTMFGVGVALLAAALIYLSACFVWRGRSVGLLGRHLAVPSARFGAWQFVLSATNWTLIAAVLWVLLRGKIDFPTVLGVYLLSAIALSVIDVPGGLGVTEAVFISLLGGRMALPELLAALVVFRAVFYIAPMLPALLAYAAIEARKPLAPVPGGDRL